MLVAGHSKLEVADQRTVQRLPADLRTNTVASRFGIGNPCTSHPRGEGFEMPGEVVGEDFFVSIGMGFEHVADGGAEFFVR